MVTGSGTTFVLFSFIFLNYCSRVFGDILFPHDTQHCLGQNVEYQCTVDGTQLTWTVYYSNGTQFALPEAYLNNIQQPSRDIGSVFTVEQLSQTPLVSNISFTVQYSIDGYTIVCSDGTTDNVNFTIWIFDDPPSPSNVKLSTNQTTLFINWTQPNSSQCITGYTINSNATNSIVNTTDTSVTIPLAGLSPDVYCTRIATIDTTDRIGQYSEEECIELNVPFLNCSTLISSNEQFSNSIIKTNILWKFQQPIIPPLSVVYLSYNVTNSTDDTVILLPANTTEYTIDLMVDITYVFTVFGGNAIENGTECNYIYYIEGIQPSPTPTPSPSSSDSSAIISAAVIAVVCVFVVLLVILVLIVVCVVFVMQVTRSRQQNEQNKRIIVAMKNIFNSCQTLLCSSCATIPISKEDSNVVYMSRTEKISN